MRRCSILLAMWAAALAAADSKQQVFDLFSRIASELSAGDATAFLDAVDRDMPQFEEFRKDVAALAEQDDVANSLEFVSDEGDDHQRVEEVDWYMQIVGRSESRPVEDRRGVVKFKLERRGKKWKVVSIDPLHFFAPPKGG